MLENISEDFVVATKISRTANTAEVNLRNVDLNLLTVFDAVMQVQNITRAAHALGMSQPAVSNAVARLKVMFNDELFMRYGRGIQPTHRAYQLFGPVRQALQIVQNELPGAGFNPSTSKRVFNVAICSPLDIRLAPSLFNQLRENAEHVQLHLNSSVSDDIERKLRYQENDFLISYHQFGNEEYSSQALFTDELVLVVSDKHPRIRNVVSFQQLLLEQHAVVCLNLFSSLSRSHYESSELARCIAYEGSDMNSVLSVVAKTEMVAIAPRWLVEEYTQSGHFGIVPVTLSDMEKNCTCYLTWHHAAERDRGHQWLKVVLSEFGGRF